MKFPAQHPAMGTTGPRPLCRPNRRSHGGVGVHRSNDSIPVWIIRCLSCFVFLWPDCEAPSFQRLSASFAELWTCLPFAVVSAEWLCKHWCGTFLATWIHVASYSDRVRSGIVPHPQWSWAKKPKPLNHLNPSLSVRACVFAFVFKKQDSFLLAWNQR